MSRPPVAVVTGAGSGIGRSIALALAGAGHRTALLGRRRERLEETAALAPAGAGTLVVPTDVTDEAQVAAAFGRALREWGRLDLLVNNAGVFGPAVEIDEVDLDEWRRTLDVNVTGAFLCAREAVRAMKRQSPQGGRIVNVGSISAHVPRPVSAAYTASKHAMTGLTRSLSLDGRPYSIACGQIDIGNAATEMTAGLAERARQADGSAAPEPTFDPRHVGEAVLQMARLPLDVNVQFITIMATTMPYIGRG
jgi:NAD(P)-dependent dehydrogenase (short-subunit alcohol dehydrogenase family)